MRGQLIKSAIRGTHALGKQVSKVYQGFRSRKDHFVYSPLKTHVEIKISTL